MLEPLEAPRRPELISDGGGLPFSPDALTGPPPPLDPQDGAVGALLAHLSGQGASRRGSRAARKAVADPGPAGTSLDEWRLLARTDDEALFGRGMPPELMTVAVRYDARHSAWTWVASGTSQPLRAARDAIRASSWRLDPALETQAQESVIRVLVTEQTFASGQRADGRILQPDIFVDDDEVVLTIFVTPRRGFQSTTRNPETPARVALPHAIGSRQLIDGGLPRL
jgi:hypothetical protein